ncbi:MAG TPA: septal ring lytic transglycosylase RlpA family protein [Edaphobacter sp.]|nr:septal ring lytic transglycosylase RlpA family protein [Edaphobacter sp.]
MIRTRYTAVAALSALVLTIAGCHKKTQAYRPPPPPASTSASNAHGKKSSVPPKTATAPGTASPLPAPQPDTQGKPISTEVGMASWYGPPYAGRKGADGTVYDQNAMTAAHLTLPLGTTVRVTNLTTNQSAVVRITDRGPFVHGRIIDLSLAAAKATGLYRMGVAKVRVEAYAPPARQNATPGGRWCVQVGAFSKEKDAVDLKNRLIRRYTTAKVIEFAGPTGHWVRINPQQPDHAHATEVADSIHVRDAEPYIIRTD